jgi:hypothetical protein
LLLQLLDGLQVMMAHAAAAAALLLLGRVA